MQRRLRDHGNGANAGPADAVHQRAASGRIAARAPAELLWCLVFDACHLCARGRGPCDEPHRSIGRSSTWGASYLRPSSADFITIIAESDFRYRHLFAVSARDFLYQLLTIIWEYRCAGRLPERQARDKELSSPLMEPVRRPAGSIARSEPFRHFPSSRACRRDGRKRNKTQHTRHGLNNCRRHSPAWLWGMSRCREALAVRPRKPLGRPRHGGSDIE